MSLPRQLVVPCGACGALLEAPVVGWEITLTQEEDGGREGISVTVDAFAPHTCEGTKR